jgi:hypothetical protein
MLLLSTVLHYIQTLYCAARTRSRLDSQRVPPIEGIYQTCDACSPSHGSNQPPTRWRVRVWLTSPANLPCSVIVQAPVSLCENTATPCRSGSYGLLVQRWCPKHHGFFVLLLLVLLLLRAPIHLRSLPLPPASLLRLSVRLKLCLRVSVPHLQIDCMNKKFSLLSDIVLSHSIAQVGN